MQEIVIHMTEQRTNNNWARWAHTDKQKPGKETSESSCRPTTDCKPERSEPRKKRVESSSGSRQGRLKGRGRLWQPLSNIKGHDKHWEPPTFTNPHSRNKPVFSPKSLPLQRSLFGGMTATYLGPSWSTKHHSKTGSDESHKHITYKDTQIDKHSVGQGTSPPLGKALHTNSSRQLASRK
jgi:hypothetical protein